tara:strand:- start:744 stop:1454 length:711 start_codon:yes stop_codon:yes gene_type:complete
MSSLRLKRGTSDPSASDFSNTGELLVNTTDGGLFTKDDSGNVVEIGSGGSGGSGLFTSYARLEDRQSGTTWGGTASAGYQYRDLNTEVYDVDGIVLGFNNVSTGTTKSNGSDTYSVSTSSNEFALGAGTYFIRASAPCAKVNLTFIYLRGTNTDGTTALNYGISRTEYTHANNLVTVNPTLGRRIIISSTKLFRISHYCSSSSSADYALGMYSSDSTSSATGALPSIYTTVDIYKE